MCAVSLTWDDNNSGAAEEDGFKVYRSNLPIDLAALPVPIATLPSGTTAYDDLAPLVGDNYYAVSTYKAGSVRFLVFDLITLGAGVAALAIVNPSAELGATGWTFAGGFESHVGGGGWPPAYVGSYLFAGGSGASGSALQDVLIGASVFAKVDAGTALLNLDWRQRSYNGSDKGDVEIEFLDSGLVSLGAAVGLGLLGAASGSWQLRQHVGLGVPVGARTVRIRIVTQRGAGSYNDAYFDDISGNIF